MWVLLCQYILPVETLFRNVLDIGTFQLGTPPKDFRLLIDSGSADLWVGAEGCVADDGSGGCVSPPVI